MPDDKEINRRDFLKKAGLAGAGIYLAGCSSNPAPSLPTPSSDISTSTPQTTNTPNIGPTATAEPVKDYAYMAVARGEDTAEITRRAVAAIGGMEKFVTSGANVIIKPNICTDNRTYDFGATTNPIVVATLVSLAFGAGAKRVRVMDNPFSGTAQSAYKKSGIEDAVIAAGGEMEIMNQNKFIKTDIPNGMDIKAWAFYKEILDADTVINVPIAKTHSTTKLTLGCKNMMGTINNRGQIHPNIHQRIADLVSRVRPALTLLDAVRVMVRYGPTGGSLDYVELRNTVIASSDIVAVDAYGTTLFGRTGDQIGYIQKAAEMGLGTMDLASIKIEEITI